MDPGILPFRVWLLCCLILTNQSNDRIDTICSLMQILHNFTGTDSVGFRLRKFVESDDRITTEFSRFPVKP